MVEASNPSEIGTRRRAREIRARFDDLCRRFERQTSTAYRLRGRAAHRFNDHMRRFWITRDRVRLHLHAARSCEPQRVCRLRERLDVDWRRLQELAEPPPTGRPAREA